MAFTITQFGRVEIDPGRIPVSQATSDIGRQDPGNAFGRVLDRAEADRGANERRTQRRDIGARDTEQLAADRQAAIANHDDATQRGDDSLRADPHASAAGTTARQAADPVDATTTNTHEGEAPTSRNDNGKGAGASPSLFSRADGDADALAPRVRTGSRIGETTASTAWVAPTSTSATAAAGIAQPTGAIASSTATQHGVPAQGITTAGSDQRAAASSSTTGYRTVDTKLLRQAEEARDSIFRQIAMRLVPTGGEMHVLVDPPELGELEMKLVVDGDNVRLTIHAERPEVALMMQKHIAELRQHLAAQGLTITDAQVHTRDPHAGRNGDARRDGSQRDARFGADADADGGDQQVTRATNGFITADGFDFWV